MRKVIWVILLLLCQQTLLAQFYLRGEVKDERGHTLENVRINLTSRGAFPYYTGNSGTFGIPVTQITDTITLQLDGFETLKQWVDTRKFQSFTMKMLPSTAQLYTGKLASATTNLKANYNKNIAVLGESYSTLVENEFIEATHYPETGFALNVDKASYSNIRRFLNNDMLVPIDAIRIEEMLNYFQFRKKENDTVQNKFNVTSQISDCPWNKDHKLLYLNIDAPKLNLDSIPPSNLVFLLDISGSMDKPNRLPLLQSAFKLLVDNLRAIDTITIVTYGGGVGMVLGPTGGDEKKKIKDVIDSLTASGDTPGEGAIRIAYERAKRTFQKKGNNRVILATDGDFNVGQVTESELEDLVIAYKQTGIYLTCLGVGMGNYKDSKLEALAKKGNGNFAYLDNLQEAEKVLVTEFTQTLFSVANNAFVKINFDPKVVKEYRLIGYDNKKNVVKDSSSELEGGEVGSGHSVMSVFEIKPQTKDSLLVGKYMANVSLQFRSPVNDSASHQHFAIHYNPVQQNELDSSYRFASSLALLGQMLKRSKFVKDISFEELQALAQTAVDPNDHLQKEMLHLIDKASKIYNPQKKKTNKQK